MPAADWHAGVAEGHLSEARAADLANVLRQAPGGHEVCLRRLT